jgi:hypothetical protein
VGILKRTGEKAAMILKKVKTLLAKILKRKIK